MARSDLYFIANPYTGLVKIGIAQSVVDRLTTLSCANGVHLTLLATLESGARHEKILHEIFWADRTVGEWFVPSDRLFALVENPSSIPEFIRASLPAVEQRRAELFAAAENDRIAKEAERKAKEAARREAERVKREAAKRREEARQRRLQEKADREASEHEAKMAAWRERNPGAVVVTGSEADDLSARRARLLTFQRGRNAAMVGGRPIADV